jgi:hypothetical protein
MENPRDFFLPLMPISSTLIRNARDKRTIPTVIDAKPIENE